MPSVEQLSDQQQVTQPQDSHNIVSEGPLHMVALSGYTADEPLTFLFEDGSAFHYQQHTQYELVDLTCSITSQLQFLFSRLCFKFRISISKDNKHIDFDETVHVGIHATHGFLPLIDPIFKIPETTKLFDFKKEKKAIALLKKVAYDDPHRNGVYLSVQSHSFSESYGVYHVLFSEANLINVPFLDETKVMDEHTVITLCNAFVLPTEPNNKKRNLENKEEPVVSKKSKRV